MILWKLYFIAPTPPTPGNIKGRVEVFGLGIRGLRLGLRVADFTRQPQQESSKHTAVQSQFGEVLEKTILETRNPKFPCKVPALANYHSVQDHHLQEQVSQPVSRAFVHAPDHTPSSGRYLSAEMTVCKSERPPVY